MDLLAAVEAVFKRQRSAILARLVRLSGGDFFAAEDALSDAVAAALEAWPGSGVPDNPAGWIHTVASRRLIDRWRKPPPTVSLDAVGAPASAPDGDPDAPFPGDDDRLSLLFACCHPALDSASQVALTLNALCGMGAPAIARAFVMRPPAMAQRLVRAKRKIQAAAVPYSVPTGCELPARLQRVLEVVYLVFNEGHTAAAGDHLTRQELSREALELARQLTQWMPDRAEVGGLYALLLLQDARRCARTSEGGDLVLLEDQDRSLWDGAQMARGRVELQRALQCGAAGPFCIQAAIAAVHSEAARPAETDWAQIEALYDRLVLLAPTPVIELNRAVAVAMHRGAAAGLATIDARVDGEALAHYLYYHATRADLLRRMGRHGDARTAYRRAIDLADNAAERRYLTRRWTEVAGE